MLRRCRLPLPQATSDAGGAVLDFEYAIFFRCLSTLFFFWYGVLMFVLGMTGILQRAQ